MKPNLIVTLVTLSAVCSLSAMEPQEIANEAARVSYYQADDGKARVQMQITDSQGRERNRALVILRRDLEDLGKQQFYVFFTDPSDVAETTFLVHKNPESDDDRWLYLPALDLVRRIAAADVRSSFVGSHFFYEDVSGRSPLDDNHTLASESDTYYVLESTPREPELVEFSRYKNWIHKESMLPVKTEYYNDDDQVYRVYEVLEVENIDGFTTVVKSKMTDKDRDAHTILTYEQVSYNPGLREDIFSERFLRNPPREVLE